MELKQVWAFLTLFAMLGFISVKSDRLAKIYFWAFVTLLAWGSVMAMVTHWPRWF